MKKLLGILVLGLLLSTNAFSKAGKGNILLSKSAIETFLDYLYGGSKNLDAKTGGGTANQNIKAKPLLFTISEDGQSFTWNYCPYSSCSAPDQYKAKLRCQKYSGGIPCFTFARKKKIIWKNDINPKGLNLSKHLKKGRFYVAQLIIDGGYYNGDIDRLKGFKLTMDSKSEEYPENQSDALETVPKKKKKKVKQDNDKENTVEQLETLTKLYEAGHLTKEEFEKAKKKVLND